MYTKVYPTSRFNSSQSQFNEATLLDRTFKNSLTEPAPEVFQPANAVPMSHQKHYITISSRDRDTTLYPNPAKFQVSLPIELRNVKAVKVVQGSFPNVTELTTVPFVYLDIPELNFMQVTSLDSQVTGVLQLKPLASSAFLGIDAPTVACQYEFNNLKDRLARLNVSLRGPDGAQIEWTTETGVPDSADQWYLSMEITTLVPKQSSSVNFAVPF
jgi:hypothetical protein